MEMDFVKQLLELGSLGIFAGFLVWQHNQLQKRLDKLTDSFKKEIRELEDRHEKAEENIRDRFDGIIARYDAQRERVFTDVVATLGDHTQKLSESHALLETTLTELRQYFSEQRIRSMASPADHRINPHT